jgi:PAS domain S-box-containing protein
VSGAKCQVSGVRWFNDAPAAHCCYDGAHMNASRFAIVNWLRRLSPTAIFTLGLLYELALEAVDIVTPNTMGFELFYLLGIAFVGWGAGARPAILLSIVSVGLIEAHDWRWPPAAALPTWVTLWNASTRLLVLVGAGWLAAEVSRLTRHLGLLVDRRTAQWKAEAEQHKATAARLADTLELNEKMIAASAMGTVAYKASGECVFVNEAIARIAGGTREQIRSGNFRQLESWKKSGLLHLAEEALKQGHPLSGEYFETTRFGKTVWVDAHMTPFVSAGEPHLLGMFYDISARKRGELLLRSQRDVGLSLSMTSDLTTALTSLLNFALQLEGIDCGGAYVTDPKTGDFQLAAHRGKVSPAFLEHVRVIRANSEPAQWVAKGEPIYNSNTQLALFQDPVREKEVLRGVAIVPLCHEGRAVGALSFSSHTSDFIPPQTRVILEALATQAAGAIARIRLERQILEISDREQARFGQEIHDGLCQQLVSLAFDANALERQLTDAGRPEAATARRIADFLDRAITEARQLSRGLFPIRLEVEGLPSALQELAKSIEERFKITCRFENGEKVPLSDLAVATHLYRITQEAVNNAVKHGRASAISIRLRAWEGQIELSVEDNGSGIQGPRSPHSEGMGLYIMEYRARSLGGMIRLGPGQNGGTCVTCCIPFQNRGPDGE